MPVHKSDKKKVSALIRKRGALIKTRDRKAARISKLQVLADKYERLARNIREHREAYLGSWRNLNALIDQLDAEIRGYSYGG